MNRLRRFGAASEIRLTRIPPLVLSPFDHSGFFRHSTFVLCHFRTTLLFRPAPKEALTPQQMVC
jgi:hypothetical protein